MKNITISIIIFILLMCSLKATPTSSNIGTGKLKVNVSYEAMGVFYNGPDQPGIGSVGTINDGEIDFGVFYPPKLSEATHTPVGYTGNWRRYIFADWDNRFIPFYVKGSPGITFNYSTTAPFLKSGKPGVVLGNSNLTGASDGVNFEVIPPAEGFQPNEFLANLNNNGYYYIRMHFSRLWIIYGCEAGERVFEVLLTCNYE